ncbi:MAG: TVP38/TMEM64 family protein, partial [Chromatiaceae bacterium]
MTGWNRQWLARGILIVVVAAVVTMGVLYRDALSVEAVRQQLDNLGAWAPIAFMAAYAVAAVAFLPGWIFTVAAGVLFGPIFGLIYALLGATLGATLAFLVARYTASDWVAEKAGGMVKRVMVGVEREGWRFVAFTRLVPLFPFNLLNYALGLTRINLMHYVAATLVCMIPGA